MINDDLLATLTAQRWQPEREYKTEKKEKKNDNNFTER